MNWISVKHKLPKEGKEVLIFDGEEMHTAVFTLECSWCDADNQPAFVYDPDGEWHGKHWHIKEYYPTFKTPVTHWMPLPEKPKE